VISGASQPTPKEKQNHMCFSLPSVEVFAAKLKRAGIAFEDLDGSQGAITTRVDKVKQIYLKDPDGYWIEINDARD
jgi:lactoylglutathione lyase